jgi:hypothetical protein
MSTEIFRFLGGFMVTKPTGALTRALAFVCTICPVCRTARKNQQGIANSFVRNIEGSLCPFCLAYEKVYGRKAHDPESS